MTAGGGERTRREKLGGVLIIAGGAALAAALILGWASLDGGSPARMTVTRACGSVAFIGVILYLGYTPTRRAGGVGAAAAAAAIIPALAVAVNNFPILPLLSGDAKVTAGAGAILAYAAESLFIGLFEETAFRGVLLLTVTERFGKTRRELFLSAVITSAVFGASHLFNLFGGASVGGTLLQVSYSFLIGGMCSLVLLLSGSLSSCVLIHAVYDFGGYLVMRCGEGTIWTAPEVALTAVVGVAAAAYFLAVSRKLDPVVAGRLTTNDTDSRRKTLTDKL